MVAPISLQLPIQPWRQTLSESASIRTACGTQSHLLPPNPKGPDTHVVGNKGNQEAGGRSGKRKRARERREREVGEGEQKEEE